MSQPARVVLKFRHKVNPLLIAAIILPWLVAVSEARNVPPEEAWRVSKKWIEADNRHPSLKSTRLIFSHRSMKPLVYQDETVGYLVELEPQGFMIVPGITELAPVKFISYEGQFEAVKEHSLLRDVLGQLLQTKKQLGYSETTNVAAISSSPSLGKNVDVRQQKRNEQLWEDILAEPPAGLAVTDSRQYVAPLMSTKWDQGFPYNMYTPTVSRNHTPTGCVATSQSQIMYFWKYPSIGIGSHSYIWNGQTLKANFEHPYYWDRMLEDYREGGTPENNDAVARLMSDVGISLNMEYSAGGSGTFPDRNNSLFTFFGYSSEIRTVYRTSYSDASAWFEVFRNQVDKGWPSSLAIFHYPSIGHSVVVDGYRTDFGNLIHVNMGWGGFSDAYYSMDEIGVPFVSLSVDML